MSQALRDGTLVPSCILLPPAISPPLRMGPWQGTPWSCPPTSPTVCPSRGLGTGLVSFRVRHMKPVAESQGCLQVPVRHYAHPKSAPMLEGWHSIGSKKPHTNSRETAEEKTLSAFWTSPTFSFYPGHWKLCSQSCCLPTVSLAPHKPLLLSLKRTIAN